MRDDRQIRIGSRSGDRSGSVALGSEAGLTLLELVVALSVFVVMVLGVAATIDSGLNLTRNNRQRSVAANLASQEMDTVRQTDFTALTARTVTEVVDGSTYTINRSLTWVSKSATSGPCNGVTSDPQMLRVRVTVTWATMHGLEPVRSDTQLTPPVGAYSADSGHIAVTVLDRDGGGAFGTSVQITGPATQSQPTNDDGCAFFAFLTPGTYTVSLNSVGYVDRQSTQNPSQTVGVTVGNVSSVQFDYDQAASLDLALTPDAGGAVPSDVPITLGNTSFLPIGVKTYAGTGATRTIGSLFPSGDGYTAWAGSCADADPEGQIVSGGGAYWPDAQRAPAFETTPGGATTGSVALKSASISVLAGGLTPVSGATVIATHAADQSCAAGETYTLGTTDAGGLLTAALPYGTWTISVQSQLALSGTWPNLVLDPNDTTTPALEVDTQ